MIDGRTEDTNNYFLILMETGKELDFFICHHHKEYSIAIEIKKVFDKLGIKSYVAHKSIPVGNDWHLEIKKKINQSKSILILATRNLNEGSQYCHYEIGYAEKAGLIKHIIFLDELVFLPYIGSNRIQGYLIKKNNVETGLVSFFEESTEIPTCEKELILGIKREVEKYIKKITYNNDLIEMVRREKDTHYFREEANKLNDYQKLSVLTQILKELKLQLIFRDYNENFSQFLLVILESGENPEFRVTFITRVFDFMTNYSSYGLKELFFELCKYSFTLEECNLIKQKYLDYLIEKFIEANTWAKANTVSKLIEQFRGDYTKDQLEKLFCGMALNNQIWDGTQAEPAVVKCLKAQEEIIPGTIKDLIVLKENSYEKNDKTVKIFEKIILNHKKLD